MNRLARTSHVPPRPARRRAARCAAAVGVGVLALLGARPTAQADDPVPVGAVSATEEQRPWWRCDGCIIDVNAGWPVVEADAFKLNFDGALGYAGRSFGVVARGGRSTYDSQLDRRDVLEVRTQAGLTGWYRFAPWPTASFDVGADVAWNQEFSEVVPYDGSGVTDETSQLVTVLGRVAGLFTPSATVRAKAALDVGVQRELYQQEIASRTGASQREDGTTTFRMHARFAGDWRFWPGVLRAGVASWFRLFDLTRERSYFIFTFGRDLAAQSTTDLATRIDAGGRLYLDLDVLSVLGVRPGIFGALEHRRSTQDGVTVSVNVPSIGLSLRGSALD